MNPVRNQIAFIDISKAVAALCVSIYHFIDHSDHTGQLVENRSAILVGFTDLLWSTVFIFFVISGFAIVGHLENARYKITDLPKFLVKRMIRIYFPFLLCIAGYLLLEMFFSWHNHEPRQIHWRQFFSNLTFSADFTGEKWYNPVFWTLAIEIQFYVFIAFVHPLFKLLTEKGFFPLVMLIFLAFPFVIPDNKLVFLYLPMLCIGYSLYMERNQFISRVTCTIAVGLSCLISGYFFGLLVGIVLAVFSILFLFLKIQKKPNRFSEMTYSYYLFHGLSGGTFLYFTARYVDSGWMAALLVIIAVGVSTAFTYMIFLLIEKPSVRWSKQWIRYKKLID